MEKFEEIQILKLEIKKLELEIEKLKLEETEKISWTPYQPPSEPYPYYVPNYYVTTAGTNVLQEDITS